MSSIGNSGVDDVDADYTSGVNDNSDVSDDNDADCGDYSLNPIDPGDVESSLFPVSGTVNVAPATDSGPSLASSGPRLFPLLHLPPELRLLIYGSLISAGDINIFRTSKHVHQEALQLLEKKALLRMNLGFTDRTSSASFPLTGSLNLTGDLTIHAPSIIQHVEIRFNISPSLGTFYNFEDYTNVIKSFGGRDIARQSCTIILDLGLDHSANHHSAPDEVTFVQRNAWRAVTQLTGFKLLVLKFNSERDYELEELLSLLEDYETVRDHLEVHLGPALLDNSVEHHCLEFHPYEFKAEEHAGTDNGM